MITKKIKRLRWEFAMKSYIPLAFFGKLHTCFIFYIIKKKDKILITLPHSLKQTAIKLIK